VLIVMSSQMGEGKTLLTSNLAASLALAGKSVVLIDADLRRPRVHSIFGISNARGVTSVLAGFCSLDDALQTYDLGGPKVVTASGNGKRSQTFDPEGLSQLTLLTSGPIPPNPGEMVASSQFAALIRQLVEGRAGGAGAARGVSGVRSGGLAGRSDLRGDRPLRHKGFDYVLIDSPAFLAVGDAAALAAGADAIVLLVNMKMTTRPMLEEARDFLRPLPANKLGVVTVMDSVGNGERYHYYSHGV